MLFRLIASMFGHQLCLSYLGTKTSVELNVYLHLTALIYVGENSAAQHTL